MSAATRDRAWLLAHLPHQGAMCLLDSVEAWDAVSLQARAGSHRDPGNPLRRAGMLPITAGIEYGAQAAAAHGALASAAPSGAGFLASMRGIAFHAARLDDIDGPLDIAVEQLGGGESGVLYRFHVSGGGRVMVEGRVTVAFVRTAT
ncbi:MAG TPA: 3-hydroxylacyl-ACP dehydratase [Usitatibacter sp.]|nr:3-hydroxylacyl-ACP dehydratase [Usitatibacter sp.]